MNANAKIILHGMIRSKNDPHYYDFSNDNKKLFEFPKKHYEYTMFAYDLSYDPTVPEKERIYKLNDYAGSIEAHLDLVSSDENTHTYRYKVTFKIMSLDYIGNTEPAKMMMGGVPFYATLKLANGLTPNFYIEVTKSKDKRGDPVLINSANNQYFTLEFFATNYHLIPLLKRTRDIPITLIETDHDDYIMGQ